MRVRPTRRATSGMRGISQTRNCGEITFENAMNAATDAATPRTSVSTFSSARQ